MGAKVQKSMKRHVQHHLKILVSSMLPSVHSFTLALHPYQYFPNQLQFINLHIWALQRCNCPCFCGFCSVSAMTLGTQQVIWISSPASPTKPTISVNTITSVTMTTAVSTTTRMTVSHVTTQVLHNCLTYIASCWRYVRWMASQLWTQKTASFIAETYSFLRSMFIEINVFLQSLFIQKKQFFLTNNLL